MPHTHARHKPCKHSCSKAAHRWVGAVALTGGVEGGQEAGHGAQPRQGEALQEQEAQTNHTCVLQAHGQAVDSRPSKLQLNVSLGGTIRGGGVTG